MLSSCFTGEKGMTYNHPFLVLSSDPAELEKQGQFISCFAGAVIGVNVSDQNTGNVLYNNIAPSSVGVWGHQFTRQGIQHKLKAAIWVRNNLRKVEDFLGMGAYLLVLGDESNDTLAAACLIRMLVASGREAEVFEQFVHPTFNFKLNEWLTGQHPVTQEDMTIAQRINELEKWLDNPN
jgi:hypothetical protein